MTLWLAVQVVEAALALVGLVALFGVGLIAAFEATDERIQRQQ